MTTTNLNMLPVHVLLREEEIAAEFASAMARRFLDEKFFYWLPPSAKAWADLCDSVEYRNANRAVQLLQREAAQIAGLAKNSARFCGIGCGEGSKDAILLESFAARQQKLIYTAADFSQTLLEMALRRCSAFATEVQGIKLDVFKDEHLSFLGNSEHLSLSEFSTVGARLQPCRSSQREERALAPAGKSSSQESECRIALEINSTVYAVLGNTLGAFDPQIFPARLRRIMQPNDFAIFDGEVFAGEETLRGYDNPENRRFAFAPLAALGVQEGRDGELHFELSRGSEGIHKVIKYFEAALDIDISFAGATLRLQKGERLRMASSIKYDESAFFQLVTGKVFLEEHFAKSDDGRFLLAVLRPTGSG